MKLSNFLKDIKNNEDEVVYYCCKHLLSKKFDVDNDSVDENELKEMFVDYSNFSKLLNDSAGIIYKKYESELNDVYKALCKKFDENHDNKYLFDFRLARVVNQEPAQFMNIEDKDTQETVIQKFEDKSNVILESKYYNKNKDSLSNELILPQRTLELIKSAVQAS